jgi:hypothetical protein
VDFEQAESRAVGAIIWNLFHDGRYLDACESGDLHTAVSKMAQPDLQPWTGDLAKDKEIAERPYYRQHSLRHMCKVLGHGSNYMGQPYTMSVHTKIEASAIKDFQGRYFAAFPGIPRWHQHVAKELMEYGYLISSYGKKAMVLWASERSSPRSAKQLLTIRKDQSGIYLIPGMLKVWRTNLVQLLLQVHDAILIQYPETARTKSSRKSSKQSKSPSSLATAGNSSSRRKPK